MFCLASSPSGHIWRLNGQNRIHVKSEANVKGDQIILTRLGLVSDIIPVAQEWVETWPWVEGG